MNEDGERTGKDWLIEMEMPTLILMNVEDGVRKANGEGDSNLMLG